MRKIKRKWTILIVVLVALCAFANPISSAFADSEIRYLGAGATWQDNETIYCDYTTVEKFRISTKVPLYNSIDSSKDNNCAPLAGATIVGYFDRWASNLMPNYVPGRSYGSVYIYSGINNNTHIQTLFNSLYQNMQTNVGSPGTSKSQFKNGLTNYVTNKGYRIAFNSVYANGTANISKLDQEFRNNTIAVMFCSTYNFVNIADNGTNVFVNRINSNTPHMVVAYGYSIYKYYNDGVCFRTDTFLDVASCTSLPMHYQLDLGGNLVLNDMLTVNIA